MNVTVHSLVVEQFSRSLEALNNILIKAEEFAAERSYEADLFLTTRLAPDMLGFTKQIQICTDVAKGAVARLTNKEAPVFEDNETTMKELKVRIGRTLEFIAGAKAEDFQGFEKRLATFPRRPGKALEGMDFLTSHALPNFYFHISIAYALLRQCGVKIGKSDFLGNQNWKEV